MSNSQIKLDPSKGFVAIPAQVLEIPMTAGAKAVLIDLCNLANNEGKAWPSLQHLADRIKRKKSSISIYLKELRELGLIETIRRKMQSGYDYKLEFYVTFWIEWLSIRSQKALKPVQNTKRSVQQVERPTTFINKPQNTHTTCPLNADNSKVKSIYEEWSECTRGTPYGQFPRPVPADLINRTETILTGFDPNLREIVPEDTKTHLQLIWKELRIEVSQQVLDEQVSLVRAKKVSEEVILTLLNDIRTSWKPFWKKPPTVLQFEKMISDAKAKHPEIAMKKIIFMHYVSWQKGQKGLHKVA